MMPRAYIMAYTLHAPDWRNTSYPPAHTQKTKPYYLLPCCHRCTPHHITWPAPLRLCIPPKQHDQCDHLSALRVLAQGPNHTLGAACAPTEHTHTTARHTPSRHTAGAHAPRRLRMPPWCAETARPHTALHAHDHTAQRRKVPGAPPTHTHTHTHGGPATHEGAAVAGGVLLVPPLVFVLRVCCTSS